MKLSRLEIVLGITTILLMLGIWYMSSRKHECPNLSISSSIDTVYVKGNTDTVYAKKKAAGSFQVSPQAVSEAIPIDTLVYDQNIIVTAKSEDLRKYPLEIQYFYDIKEKEIVRVDTIKITKVDSVKITDKPEVWYDEFEYGYIAGTLVTAGIMYLLKDK